MQKNLKLQRNKVEYIRDANCRRSLVKEIGPQMSKASDIHEALGSLMPN
jgi:hypothetical protein